MSADLGEQLDRDGESTGYITPKSLEKSVDSVPETAPQQQCPTNTITPPIEFELDSPSNPVNWSRVSPI
jgi:hypothetical protein